MKTEEKSTDHRSTTTTPGKRAFIGQKPSVFFVNRSKMKKYNDEGGNHSNDVDIIKFGNILGKRGLVKKHDIFWEFFPIWGEGSPESQNFCNFAKSFLACQIHS